MNFNDSMIGKRATLKPAHTRIVSGSWPKEGIVTRSGALTSSMYIATNDGEHHVWVKDYTITPIDPHAAFQDHYL